MFSAGDYSVFNLGYSHYIAVIVGGQQILRARRARVFCQRRLTTLVFNLRRYDPYRGRGMQNFLALPKLKEGKKR